MKLDISGTVNFECSNTNFNYVADIVSEKLTGKKHQLSGFENYIRDEVPTVYSEDIFGLRIILMQNPEEETQFQIEILDRTNIMVNENFDDFQNVNISSRMYDLLKSCKEFIFSNAY